MYTQKNKLIAPSYTSEREGPPHASRFKCRVTVDGKIFESPEFHSTLKEAEHAAAKVALMSLSPDVVQKVSFFITSEHIHAYICTVIHH